MLMLLLLLLMVVLVVASTVGTVHDGCFVGNSSSRSMTRDGGVALWLRWGSIVACRWIHGWVGLHWT